MMNGSVDTTGISSSPKKSPASFGPLGALGPLGPLDQLGPDASNQSIPHSPTAILPSSHHAQTINTSHLQFQDIAHNDSDRLISPFNTSSSSSSSLSSSSFNSASSLPSSFSPSDNSLPASVVVDEDTSAEDARASFYQVGYYRHLFNVTTDKIAKRLFKAAITPFQKNFYDAEDPSDKPDLYGPFWVTTTLIFLLAAAGNFANYLVFMPSEEEPEWRYNFQKMTIGATVFYSYISVWPVLIYCLASRVGDEKSLVQIASIHGYSLVTFCPVCVICIAPFELVRWVSMGVVFIWSSLFLLRNIYTEDNKKMFPVCVTVLLAHLGICALTRLYFFEF